MENTVKVSGTSRQCSRAGFWGEDDQKIVQELIIRITIQKPEIV